MVFLPTSAKVAKGPPLGACVFNLEENNFTTELKSETRNPKQTETNKSQIEKIQNTEFE